MSLIVMNEIEIENLLHFLHRDILLDKRELFICMEGVSELQR